MALVYDGTVNGLRARVADLEGEVFGPDASAYRLHQKLTGVEPLSSATVLAPGASTPRTLAARAGDVVNVKDYGAVGDGVTDDTAAIQAALDAASATTKKREVHIPSGTYMVSSTINVPTQVHIRGESMIATVIKMASLPTGDKPAYTGTTTLPPTLDYFPILWNKSPIDWWAISDITLDGNDLDVYGLRLQENYHGDITRVVINSCNKRPYINIRGQLINHTSLAVYDNREGVLFYNWTAINFNGVGFERNNGTFYLEMRQPLTGFNKGSTHIAGCWFEAATDKAPSTAFFGFSGRAVRGNGLFFHPVSPLTYNGLHAIDSGDTITVDNIVMDTAPTVGACIEQVNYTGAIGTYLGTGTKGSSFYGQFNSSASNDNSGETTNTIRFQGSGIDFPYVHGRWQARRSYAGVPSIAPDDDFNIDVQNDLITLFEQANNYIRKVTGILEFGANGILRLRSGATAGQNVVILNQAGTSNWESGHLVLSGYHLWKDAANRLRAHTTTPASDTDGTIIGPSLSGSATWDPASIANGGGMTSTTVTVTGAAIGDTVAVGFSQALPAGAILSGAVTAADTVTISLVNHSSTNPLDLASGTVRADVWQR